MCLGCQGYCSDMHSNMHVQCDNGNPPMQGIIAGTCNNGLVSTASH